MTRPIKFRVWDKETWNKETDDIFNWDELGTYWIGALVTSPKFVLEQFTGLTDKNYKDIYENDILKIRYTDRDSEIHTSVGKVVFFSGSFHVTWQEKYDTDPLSARGISFSKFITWHVETEVIGNIHENKDLLEEK
ncbi:hypothetical protein ATX71_09865 [Oenococcus oeni]|uniref:YopX family protein n=1 Tax=Oenococcus oeni TaxID=1247 RepID=UPI0008F822F0|nr:YopX family protein [Oenococcus oeni]OIL54565.1 hypothetical protein ATX21_09635 [Oenococcus oeni]OIL57895.1 hypothetical protein ATX22_02485 [Oenococcus oeni]OIM35850.1 hypothetical protein ATX71_09865 [Oenococcus oeni]